MKKRIFGMIAMMAGICLMAPIHAMAETVSENNIVETTDEVIVPENGIVVEEDEQTVSENEITEADEQTVSENSITDENEEPTLELENPASEYNDLLLAEKNTLQNYYVYSSQLNAQRMKLKLDYLTGLQEEWSERLRIEEKKLELGYTTMATVEEVRCQYNAVQLQIEETSAMEGYYTECISLYEGEYAEQNVSQEWTALSEDYVEKFMADSTQKMSYQEQIAEYREALESVGADTEYGSNIANQLQIAELSLKQYEMNLEAYVKELQLQHQNIGRNVSQTDNQIDVMEMKIQNAQSLLDEGKITQIEVTELENELKRLEYERTDLLYDAQLIYYILSNTIENQSV